MNNVKDDFILLPTNDVCFEKLMANPKVRKGLVSALLGIDPDKIKSTVGLFIIQKMIILSFGG